MDVFCISLPSDLLVMLRFLAKDILHNFWMINSARFSSVSEHARARHSRKLEEEEEEMMNLHLVIDPSFVIMKVKFSSTSVAAYFLE
jgi:hypothetical protein